MVLVDYSDSGSSDGDNSILVTTTKSPLKRKRSTQLSTTERLAVLPAPESLHDLNPPLAAAKGPLTRKCGTKVDAIRRAGVDSCLPPLPDSFHDLYSSSTRNARQDDPSLHAGRQRSTPHVQGNWPTHVYAECKSNYRPLGLKCHYVVLSLLTERRVSFKRRIKLSTRADDEG